MKLYEKPEESAVCGATHSCAAFPFFSFPSPSFSPFFSLRLGPTNDPIPFPRQKRARRSRAARRGTERERREGGRERGPCPKTAISFFHRQGFLEQAASRWTPPGFGNVSIRDSAGRRTETRRLLDGERERERERQRGSGLVP